MDGNLIAANDQTREFHTSAAIDQFIKSIPENDKFRDVYLSFIGDQKTPFVAKMRADVEKQMNTANALAKAFRQNSRSWNREKFNAFVKSGIIAKADLDVGTLTNFAQITGGQSLGYVSLDTQMARGTTRPNNFTLYQSLHKSAAFQVVDYWAYASDTGAGLPGTAFQGFGNVASGTLQTSAGIYSLNNVTLKLAVNGRAITTALAAQNSFVDVSSQENINAALAVLESVNWACYWGNPTLYPNQFQGIFGTLPASNVFDFGTFTNTYSGQGWSNAQAMFNLIYQAAGQITGYRNYGRVTHAYMSPTTAGSLQGLVTTLLNNIVNHLTTVQGSDRAIVVNGDLQGMRTRFGEIQFPVDLYITARDKPAQTVIYGNGQSAATSTGPTPPVSVALTSGTVTSGSAWTAAYAASSGIFSYAVASCDSAMNESVLTYGVVSGGSALSISGIVSGTGKYSAVITGPVAADAAVFRVYRSGLGYNPASSGVANANSYRYVGSIAASGGAAVTFVDLNVIIPGAETVFLLDLDENDNALDFRYLLPLTKIELFAQNLFMPWAVAAIGTIRNRVPKFHGAVVNYIPDNPEFSPLLPNPNAV